MTGGDRGRVPFALLGVLLLVGSGSYAATLTAPAPAEAGVAESMAELDAAVGAAVEGAVRDAATAAAADPVTEASRASLSARPFRDALRLRVYTRRREGLAALARSQDGLRLSASLPTPESAAEVRRAVRRVELTPVEDGRRLRATVENVTLTARRGGTVVGRQRVSPTVTVSVPVLAVHRRVRRFERLLNAGPTAPGLGRRLTATLYPIAWARGYARYSGAPVDNVVANRYVALATNGAADPVGERAHTRAAASVAVSDLLTGSGHPGLRALERVRQAAGATPDLPARRRLATRAREAGPSPNAIIMVGVNRTATRAFVALVGARRGWRP